MATATTGTGTGTGTAGQVTLMSTTLAALVLLGVTAGMVVGRRREREAAAKTLAWERPRTHESRARPVGLDPEPCANPLKEATADAMVAIAQLKETRKSSVETPAQLEAFHHAEDHEFFNESFYYNGCDWDTKDRIITRISHRGKKGKRSYVFLLLDIAGEGELALEEDVEAETAADGSPTALGLKFTCEVPMMRWRITYSGPMRRGCVHPQDKAALAKAERVHADIDLVYDTDSPLFWYMRDDHPKCLARNLTQEPWGLNFLKTCIKRTADHGHYEDFGRLRGTVRVKSSPAAPTRSYDFATFRDHSWDVRRWATMDNLCILLIALEKPLRIDGHDYWYVDLTLVDMPGNTSGVARYSTGYIFGRRGSGAPPLVLVAGTSIKDVGYSWGPVGYPGGPKERFPLEYTECVMHVAPHPKHQDPNRVRDDAVVRIVMSGKPRRLIYWPDHGAFKCYEDCQDFAVSHDGQTVAGYGTKQRGFRVGDFDPTLGGCG